MPPILRYPLYMHEVSTNANDNIGIPLLFFAYPQEPVSHFYLLNSVRGFSFFDTKKKFYENCIGMNILQMASKNVLQ